MTNRSTFSTQSQTTVVRTFLIICICALTAPLIHSTSVLWGVENKEAISKEERSVEYSIRSNTIWRNRPMGDFLAIYHLPTGELNSLLPTKFERPTNCKVPSPEEAEKIAKRYREENNESPNKGEEVALILAARKVPDFTEINDYIWVVRYVTEDEDILDELWISSTTGSCISVFDITPQVPIYYKKEKIR